MSLTDVASGAWNLVKDNADWIVPTATYGLLSFANADQQKEIYADLQKGSTASYEAFVNALQVPEEVKKAQIAQAKYQAYRQTQQARRETSDALAARGIRGRGLSSPLADEEEELFYSYMYPQIAVETQPPVPAPYPQPVSPTPSTGQLMGADIGGAGQNVFGSMLQNALLTRGAKMAGGALLGKGAEEAMAEKGMEHLKPITPEGEYPGAPGTAPGLPVPTAPTFPAPAPGTVLPGLDVPTPFYGPTAKGVTPAGTQILENSNVFNTPGLGSMIPQPSFLGTTGPYALSAPASLYAAPMAPEAGAAILESTPAFNTPGLGSMIPVTETGEVATSGGFSNALGGYAPALAGVGGTLLAGQILASVTGHGNPLGIFGIGLGGQSARDAAWDEWRANVAAAEEALGKAGPRGWSNRPADHPEYEKALDAYWNAMNSVPTGDPYRVKNEYSGKWELPVTVQGREAAKGSWESRHGEGSWPEAWEIMDTYGVNSPEWKAFRAAQGKPTGQTPEQAEAQRLHLEQEAAASPKFASPEARASGWNSMMGGGRLSQGSSPFSSFAPLPASWGNVQAPSTTGMPAMPTMGNLSSSFSSGAVPPAPAQSTAGPATGLRFLQPYPGVNLSDIFANIGNIQPIM